MQTQTAHPSPEVLADRRRIARHIHDAMEEMVSLRDQCKPDSEYRRFVGIFAASLAKLATLVRDGVGRSE